MKETKWVEVQVGIRGVYLQPVISSPPPPLQIFRTRKLLTRISNRIRGFVPNPKDPDPIIEIWIKIKKCLQ